MKELPKKLFDTVDFGKERRYYFINLKGEQDYVELRDIDQLTTKTCPIDGTYIVNRGGDPHGVAECPACGEGFEGREEMILKRIKRSYNQLKEEADRLEKIIELAENPDNEIKKANLHHKAYENKANQSSNEW